MPKHRAQRQGEGSDRRVPIRDATTAVKTALAKNRPGTAQVLASTAVDDVPTAPLPAVDEFTVRPGTRRPVPRGWLSGSLVNPWFAAATGLVIAAGLYLYSPHKGITYLPNVTGPPAHCQVQGCTQDPPHQSLASRGPSQRIRPARHSHSRSLSSGATVAARHHILVHLAVIRHDRNGFVAEVTLRGRQKLGSWRLAFSLPGAQIHRVVGAQWQASGPHAGVATAADPFGGGWPYGGHHHGRWHGYHHLNRRVAQFWIIGSGSTAGATGCEFDGQHCVFR
jgi:hypothetical protein